MANKKNEAKVKFSMETAEAREQTKKAANEIKILRSELRLSAEEMKTNGTSLEGLQKQYRLLENETKQYETKLDAINTQIEKATEIYGENSDEVARLKLNYNNTATTLEKVKQQLAATEKAMDEQRSSMQQVDDAVQDTRNSYEKLEDTVQEQRDKLERLQSEYKNAALEMGSTSDEAKDLKEQIKALSSEIHENESKMNQLDQEAKEASGEMEDLTEATKDAEEGFTVMKGAMGTFLGNAMTKMVDIAKEGVTSIYNLADETREYRGEMNKLSSAATSNGYTTEYAKQKYMDLYSVLADETASNTTVSNFMAMQMSQENLNTVLHAATGIWAKYGDSIPLDGLAESINETANVGTVTGNLADALNWAGINEDDFNSKLSLCGNTQERQSLIVNTLEQAYGTLADSYQENNKNVMEANRTAAEYNDTMADLGAEIEPVTTAIKKGFTEVVKAGIKMVDADMDEAAEKIGDAFEWIAENMDDVVRIAKGGAAVLGTMFAVNKASQFISSIRNITSVMGLFKIATTGAAAATTAQTAAQEGLNLAMLASPAGILTAALGATALAVYAAVEAHKKQEEELQKEMEQTYGLTDAEKELTNTIDERAESLESSKAAREENAAGIEQEWMYYQKLSDELKENVDANGKIKEGYEDRAAVITGILSSALGEEITITDGVIDNYKELSNSIDDLIQKKKAEATLNAYDSSYQDAIKGQTDAFNELAEAKETLAEKSKTASETEKAHADALEELNNAINSGATNDVLYDLIDNEHETAVAAEEAAKAQKKAADSVDEAEQTWTDYNTTIKNYEGLSEAIISGDNEKIEQSMEKLTTSFITAENGNRESLERQVTNYQAQADQLKTAIENKTPGVTQEMLDQANSMVEAAKAELAKLPPEAQALGMQSGASAATGVASQKGEMETAARGVKAAEILGLSSEDTTTVGETDGLNYVGGLRSVDTWTPAKQKADDAKAGLNSGETTSAGKKDGTNYASGLRGVDTRSAGAKKANDAKSGLNSGNTAPVGRKDTLNYIVGLASVNTQTPASKKASEAKKGLASQSTIDTGYNFAAGFANGIDSYPITTKIKGFALGALATLKRNLGINSPSKETYKFGEFFNQGFANAVNDTIPETQEVCKIAAQSYLEPFKEISGTDFSMGMSDHLNRQLEISANSRISQDFSSALEPIQSGNQNLADRIAEALKNQNLTMVLDSREIGRIRR